MMVRISEKMNKEKITLLKQQIILLKVILMVKVFLIILAIFVKRRSTTIKISTENVEWIDITNNLDAQSTEKSYKDLLRRMHNSRRKVNRWGVIILNNLEKHP